MIFKYKQFLKDELTINRTKNKKYEWLLSDSKENFYNNINQHSESLHLKNYLKNPINYNLNDYGFRTNDSFDSSDIGNIFLGCSHTFGIGHYLENVWSYKLSQEIGDRFFNISEPGSGVMTQYRYLVYFINKLKVKNVFHYLPDEDWYRYEYIKENGAFGRILYDDLPPKVIDNLFDEKQVHLINYIYIDAIRQLLNSKGINYYLYTKSYANVENMNPYHETWIPARDLIHYYVEEQNELYKIFKFKYQHKLVDNFDNDFLINEINPTNPKLL